MEPFNAARALEAVRAATAGRGAFGNHYPGPAPGAAPSATAQGGAPGGAQAQREVQMLQALLAAQAAQVGLVIMPCV